MTTASETFQALMAARMAEQAKRPNKMAQMFGVSDGVTPAEVLTFARAEVDRRRAALLEAERLLSELAAQFPGLGA